MEATGAAAVVSSSVEVGGTLLATSARWATDPLAEPIRTTLLGRPGEALPAFQRAATPDHGAATWARAAAWGSYAASLRVNAFPGGIVASGADVTRRPVADLDTPGPPPAVPDEVSIECELIGSLLPRLRLTRTVLGPTLAGGDHGDLVDATLTAADVLAARADGAGAAAVASFCRRARADLLHRAGRRAEAVAALEAALTAAAGDGAATAAAHLLVGDHALAPLTHPDAADHVLFDAGLETSALPWSLEQREADASATALTDATVAYDAAAAALGPEAAGCGLLALRRSGVARLAGDASHAVELADHAHRLASKAGDDWLARTAQVHGLLARTAAGGPPEPAAAEAVGRWGAADGSFAYAVGLGLLLARAGRQWLLRGGDADRAVTCHRLARRLFTALGASIHASQSRADEAAALAAIGASDAAVVGYEDAFADHLVHVGDPGRGADAWRRAALLALRVHHLRLSGDDGAQLRTSAARLAQVLAAQPTEPAGDGDDALRQLVDEARRAAAVHAVLTEGDAARDAGDDTRATERFVAALSAAEAAGDDLARAVCAARLGRHAEATAAYRRHEEVAATEVARQLETLREQLGDGADAIIAQLDQTGAALRRAAAFHTRVGAYDAAAAAFDGLDRHEPAWVAAEERPWELLSDHGRVREERGELDRAATLHEQAIAELERRTVRVARDERKVALNAGSGRVLGRAARTALRRAQAAGEPLGVEAERSFSLAERGRGRALAELLAAGAHVTASAEQDEVVRRWIAASARAELQVQLLADELAAPAGDPARAEALRRRLELAEDEVTAAAVQLREARPVLAEVVSAPPPTTADDVAACLAEGTALVSYLVVDDDLLTWAVTSEGLVAASRRRIDARALHRALVGFTVGCATGGAWVEDGRTVASLLLDPVRDVVAGARRLHLVPTGIGHAAPLHALPWDDGLLLDHAAVAVLPAAGTLRHLASPTGAPRPPALVVGDPTAPALPGRGGPSTAPPPLPGARLEAAAVAARYPGATLLVGPAATHDAVLEHLPGAGTVHIAAHAAVDAAAPLATAVLLAHGGQLTVADLVGTRLDADLVVLSACDSGRGRVTGGDEVIGMTRALLAAGASAAVVSLWPVDDRSTALLLSRFTDHVAAGVDPSSALRQAQVWFRGLDDDARSRALADLAEGTDGVPPAAPGPVRAIVRREVATAPPLHPFHWAGFVHVGAHGTG